MSDGNDSLTKRFPGASPTALEELEDMLSLYKISPEELFWKWEAYSLKLGYASDVKITIDLVLDFRRDELQTLEAGTKGGKRGAGAAKTGTSAGGRAIKPELVDGGNVLGLFDTTQKSTGTKRRNEYETPSSKRYAANNDITSSPLPTKALTISQPRPPTSFAKRPSPFTVRDTLNSHLIKPPPPSEPSWSSRVNFVVNYDMKKFAYRPMHQKLYETSEQLDDKIERVQKLISESLKIPFDEFSDPSALSLEDVTVVGRICSDSISDGKLNEASLVLESSRRVGNCSRIPLKFDKLEKVPPNMIENEGSGICLFPGQIVAFRGVNPNPNNNFFSVKEILEIPKLPPGGTSVDELAAIKERCEDGLRLMIASGPYTTHDNLDFEPLAELCQRARDTKPDVLILMGPFIDIAHPMVAEGDFDLEEDGEDRVLEGEGTLENLFRQRITRKIRIVDQTATMVILIPSTRDAVSKHVSFPQEPFTKKPLGLAKNVRLVSNPCIFSLNNIVFGLTTTDPLFDLSRTQLVFHPPLLPKPNHTLMTSTPPFVRAVRHILTQRTFYPVFPPPLQPASTSSGPGGAGATGDFRGVPLDLAYLSLTEFLNIIPDVLILPSQLDAFVRVVDDVVAVNPGVVCRKAGYATFVEMWIGGRELGEGENSLTRVEPNGVEQVMVTNKVYERVRVDVVKV